MLDKQLHELIERLGENRNNSDNRDFKPVEFKIYEQDSNGNLVSRPVRSVQYLNSNSNSNSNQSEPIVTELGGRSKAGSSASVTGNINKVKVITDFIIRSRI